MHWIGTHWFDIITGVVFPLVLYLVVRRESKQRDAELQKFML